MKRWKLNWCDLWIDGNLCFYKNESRRDLEHRVSLKTCLSPPESNPRENLIVVQLSNGSTVFQYDPYEDSYEVIPSTATTRSTSHLEQDQFPDQIVRPLPQQGGRVPVRTPQTVPQREVLPVVIVEEQVVVGVVRRSVDGGGEGEGDPVVPVVDGDGPDVDEDVEAEVEDLVKREHKRVDVVREALHEAVHRVESVAGERRRDLPDVVEDGGPQVCEHQQAEDLPQSALLRPGGREHIGGEDVMIRNIQHKIHGEICNERKRAHTTHVDQSGSLQRDSAPLLRADNPLLIISSEGNNTRSVTLGNVIKKLQKLVTTGDKS
ncbi:hypothetical protein F7725_006495 [Dissostichus mawsoni]|uniref:PH domain-containing protein n=1 Tax=Dissostichus mawsoni TaxID=36200 RepID=A0A7J5XV10_DISMA|nr:hypothetical protein F7725_006495 [Dissostichus mawsoni]